MHHPPPASKNQQRPCDDHAVSLDAVRGRLHRVGEVHRPGAALDEAGALAPGALLAPVFVLDLGVGGDEHGVPGLNRITDVVQRDLKAGRAIQAATVLLAVGELARRRVAVLVLRDAALAGRDVQVGLQQAPGSGRLVGDGQRRVVVADLDVAGVDGLAGDETVLNGASQVCAAASPGQNAGASARASSAESRRPVIKVVTSVAPRSSRGRIRRYSANRPPPSHAGAPSGPRPESASSRAQFSLVCWVRQLDQEEAGCPCK